MDSRLRGNDAALLARPSVFSVISVAKSVFEMGSAFDCVPEVALTNVSRSGRAVGAVLVGH